MITFWEHNIPSQIKSDSIWLLAIIPIIKDHILKTNAKGRKIIKVSHFVKISRLLIETFSLVFRNLRYFGVKILNSY